MDFGLANLKGALGLTQTGGTAGTFAYMAPEQIMGSGVDERVDIFSFGVVFFELLTGRFPFRGDQELVMMYSILNEEPQKLSALRNDVPGHLVHLIGTCLQKKPESRYQTVVQMLQDLASPSRTLAQKPAPLSRSAVGLFLRAASCGLQRPLLLRSH